MKAKIVYMALALALALSLAAVVVPAEPAQATPSWWNTVWEYRQKLTFDNSGQSESLVNFPVLVKLDSTNIDYGKTRDSGQDIRFVDSNDSTVLSHEIEKWDETGDSWVWVNVPQIDGSSSADHIYMYYGNPSAPDEQNPIAVWDTHYKGIWHLNGVSGSVLDSTTNDNDGTNSGSIRGASGKIDDAFNFDGTDDYVEVPDSSSLDITAVVTIEAWVNPAEFSNYSPGIACKWDWSATNPQRSYSLYLATYRNTFFMISADGSYQAELLSDTVLATDTWYHLTGVSTGSKWIIYINGQMDCEIDYAASIHNGTAKFSIGASMKDGSVATDETFEGAIDEVRVSDTVRSADWIKAQHLSMTDYFITYGSEESAEEGGEGCFIATAAYGTSTAEEIDVLRAFRDEVLLESTLGSQLVEWYYDVSPPVADFISENSLLSTIVRELLVDPVASLVEATKCLWQK